MPVNGLLDKNKRPNRTHARMIGSDFTSFSGVRKAGKKKSISGLRNLAGAKMSVTAQIIDRTRLAPSSTSVTLRAQKPRGQAKASARQQRGSACTRWRGPSEAPPHQ